MEHKQQQQQQLGSSDLDPAESSFDRWEPPPASPGKMLGSAQPWPPRLEAAPASTAATINSRSRAEEDEEEEDEGSTSSVSGLKISHSLRVAIGIEDRHPSPSPADLTTIIHPSPHPTDINGTDHRHQHDQLQQRQQQHFSASQTETPTPSTPTKRSPLRHAKAFWSSRTQHAPQLTLAAGPPVTPFPNYPSLSPETSPHAKGARASTLPKAMHRWGGKSRAFASSSASDDGHGAAFGSGSRRGSTTALGEEGGPSGTGMMKNSDSKSSLLGKLPRPRSWVSNLLSVSPSKSALSPLRNRLRAKSMDEGQRQEEAQAAAFATLAVSATDTFERPSLEPVSALVLSPSVGLERPLVPGSPENINGWTLPPAMRNGPSMDHVALSVAPLGDIRRLEHNRLAAMSTPNLGSPAMSDPLEPRAPLTVRNLDAAPRGALTPSVPAPLSTDRKITNPWGKVQVDDDEDEDADEKIRFPAGSRSAKRRSAWRKPVSEVGSTAAIRGESSDAAQGSSDRTSSASAFTARDELVDAEEEERRIEEGIQTDAREGRMAEEEMAVLKMLYEMSSQVDTFSSIAPSALSRSQTQVTPASAGPSRPTLGRSKTSSEQAESSGGSTSPEPSGGTFGLVSRKSVKNLTAALESAAGAAASFAPSSLWRTSQAVIPPVAEPRSAPSSVLSKANSKTPSQTGSVKQAIAMREATDREARSPSPSRSALASGGGERSASPTRSLLAASERPFPFRPRSLVNQPSTNSLRTTLSERAKSVTTAAGHLDANVQAPDTEMDDYSPPSPSKLANRYERNHSIATATDETTSPGLSYYSSGAEAPSSLWGRGHNRDRQPLSPSTVATSPGLPSSSEGGMPPDYGFGRRKHMLPLLRRLETDATAATSIYSNESPTRGKFASRTDHGGLTSTEMAPTTSASGSSATGHSEASAQVSVKDFALPMSSSGSSVGGKLSSRPVLPAKERGLGSTSASLLSDASTTGTSTLLREHRRNASALEASHPLSTSIASLRSPAPLVEQGYSPALLGSPPKAKDLIKFFEQGSASPTLSPSKLGSSTPDALRSTPVKLTSTPTTTPSTLTEKLRKARGLSSLRSTPVRTVGAQTTMSNVDNSPTAASDAVAQKVSSMPRIGMRPRTRLPSAIAVGGRGGGGDDPFALGDSDDEDAENEVPSMGDSPRRSGGRRRTSRGVSAATIVPGVLGASSGARSSPAKVRGSDSPSGLAGGSVKGNEESPSRRSGSLFRNSVQNLVSAFSTRNAAGGTGGGGEAPGPSKSSPSAWRNKPKPLRRRSSGDGTESEAQSAVSTRTLGTSLSYRHRSETGSLPFDTRGALELIGQNNTPPLRAGVIFYFNVHQRNPQWQRTQAVLLPTAVALSWIPPGGGRENVVLDLRACREVHSVPGPEHPSSARDAGALAARRQDLHSLSPFELIFDDGVERLAAESATERVHWVNTVWDALNELHGSQVGSAPDIRLPRSLGADSTPVLVTAARMAATPASPAGSPHKDRNGSAGSERDTVRGPQSLYGSGMSSDGETAAGFPSIAAALATGPPVPPKDDPAPAAPTSAPLEQEEDEQVARALSPQGTASSAAPSSSTKVSQARSNGEPLSAHDESAYASAAASATNLTRADCVQTHSGLGSDVIDDFDPPTPRSEAVFNWGIPDRELIPGDSASQRPARSEQGTISSRASRRRRGIAEEEIEEEEEEGAMADGQHERVTEGDSVLEHVAEEAPTPAQALRDSVMGAYTPEGQWALDTVIEETQSQAQSSQLLPGGGSARAVSVGAQANLGTIPSPSITPRRLARRLASSRGGSQLSAASGSTVNSQDVARLLAHLEEQQEARQAREAQLEEQLKAFQDAIASLQRRATGGSRHSRRSARRSSTSSIENDGSSSRSSSKAELRAMQEKLDKMMAMMGQVVGGNAITEEQREQLNALRSPSSEASSNLQPHLERIEDTLQSVLSRITSEGLPGQLRPENRELEAALHGLSGRDRAILADRLVNIRKEQDQQSSDARSANRQSAPPAFQDDPDILQWSSDVPPEAPPGAGLAPSRSESVISDGRPAGMPWGVDAAAGVGPAPGFSLMGDTSMVGNRGAPRAAFVPAPNSNVGLDMHAEILRRRAQFHQQHNIPEQQPYPPPEVHFTPQPGRDMAHMNDGLGLSVPNIHELDSNSSGRGAPRQLGDQSIQAVLESHVPGTSSRPELDAIVQALKETEEAREAQQRQQADIARYLNELNSWLERDVVDRSKEWRTLATGFTQLHEELAAIKNGAVPAGLVGAAAAPIVELGDAARGGDVPDADPAVVPPTPLRPGENYTVPPPVATPEFGQGGQWTVPAMAAGAAAAAAAPATVRRSGTRTWHAEASAGARRNEDVWLASGSLPDKEKLKKEKRKKRIDAAKRFAVAAGGAALVSVALAEWEKHKQRQREEGKPEEAAKDADESGAFPEKTEVPENLAEDLIKAASDGDEEKIREVVKMAAELGAGKAAVDKIAEHIRSGGEEGEAGDDGDSDATVAPSEAGTIQPAVTTADPANQRSAKSSGSTEASAASIGAAPSVASTGALAMAVEEILKHLLKQKEEEQTKQAEAARKLAEAEAARHAEELAREAAIQAQREKERSELVDMIMGKLEAEKERQAAAEAEKQKEMDPKTAIESLVAAINTQRQTEAQQQAAADAAIKDMANELLKTTTEQNGKLVEAVHAAAREMLRHNVDAHADEMKKTLSKEITMMFEDVGKIREAKRALEHEIADLFSIKSRHLAGLDRTPLQLTYPSTSGTPDDALRAAAEQAVRNAGGGHAVVAPMVFGAGAPAAAAAPPAEKAEDKKEEDKKKKEEEKKPSATMGLAKKDFLSPFSINFGPRPKA